jgi:hypothetical protein
LSWVSGTWNAWKPKILSILGCRFITAARRQLGSDTIPKKSGLLTLSARSLRVRWRRKPASISSGCSDDIKERSLIRSDVYV